MTNLLQLAREKSERLVDEAEEASALIQSVELFFQAIPKYRRLLSKELDNFDEFVDSLYSVNNFFINLSLENNEKIKNIKNFITVGEELLGGDGGDGRDEPRKSELLYFTQTRA